MEEIKDSSVLRPYYDPETFNVNYPAVFRPDKGVIDHNGLNIASKLTIVNQSASGSLKSLNGKISGGSTLAELTTGLKSKFLDGIMSPNQGSGSKSLNDLEWNDMINLNVWRQLMEKLLKQLSSKYFQHLIRQPFEISKLLLQVGDFDHLIGDKKSSAYHDDNDSGYDNDELEEEDDEAEPNFFVNESQVTAIEKATKHEQGDLNENGTLIKPASLDMIDILNSIMDKEGIQGVWRANNTEFIYNFLSVSLDAWFTGLLSPLLQIPDPYFIDIIHSPDVAKSAGLILLASCMSRLVLLPLDLIRVRLIISSVQSDDPLLDNDRSLRKLIRRWSWRENISKLDKDLVFLNIMYSLVGTSFSKLTGALLYHQFNIDKFTNVVLYNTMKFVSKVCELFVRLPIENLLRRSQVKFLMTENPFQIKRDAMIIKPREYVSTYQTVFKQYGRIGELWRGWRLGLLSILCGYSLKILNKPEEVLEEEKF
ncbi:unnamed protein product [Kluyveromyces dobzhanskii CBS 2104]|uniref:WGS project CCBQ000000000 data, contig 00106 n=1 Tax=Kluyveromyces dobzhanskii CBS 2104 TaxID=1427455 RepID=A0A0A8L833_9SACH|nr:unnamed protein product [Kluyveromyces dobzhanskii CBS 2104]